MGALLLDTLLLRGGLKQASEAAGKPLFVLQRFVLGSRHFLPQQLAPGT
jgi:hypothetical protein